MSSNKHGSLAVVTDYRLVSHTPLVPSQNPTITIAFQCRITRHLAPLCFSMLKILLLPEGAGPGQSFLIKTQLCF